MDDEEPLTICTVNIVINGVFPGSGHKRAVEFIQDILEEKENVRSFPLHLISFAVIGVKSEIVHQHTSVRRIFCQEAEKIYTWHILHSFNQCLI